MSREKLPGDQLKPFHYSLCGAYSGVITRAVAQPLDVLKIRFQLQAEPIRRKIVSTVYLIKTADLFVHLKLEVM